MSTDEPAEKEPLVPQTPEQQEPVEDVSKRSFRPLHIARNGLAAVVGLGITFGSAYLGYKFAEIGVESQPLGEIPDKIALGIGAIAGGGLGLLAAVEVAPAVAGE